MCLSAAVELLHFMLHFILRRSTLSARPEAPLVCVPSPAPLVTVNNKTSPFSHNIHRSHCYIPPSRDVDIYIFHTFPEFLYPTQGSFHTLTVSLSCFKYDPLQGSGALTLRCPFRYKCEYIQPNSLSYTVTLPILVQTTVGLALPCGLLLP